MEEKKMNSRPPQWMPRTGDFVDYHSIIGGDITLGACIVQNVGVSSSGTPIAWITGKAGYVSCDALTPCQKN
jgi:hypothetical protein